MKSISCRPRPIALTRALAVALLLLAVGCTDDVSAGTAADVCVDEDTGIGGMDGAPCSVELWKKQVGQASLHRGPLDSQALKLASTGSGEHVAAFSVRLPTYCSGGVDSAQVEAPDDVTVTFAEHDCTTEVASLSGSAEQEIQWAPGWTYMRNQFLCVRVSRHGALLNGESITIRLRPKQSPYLEANCPGYPELVVRITP